MVIRTTQVPVSLGDRSYTITIGPGLLRELGVRLRALTASGLVGVVTDRHVARHYLKPALIQLKRAGFTPVPIILPPGEETKTFATIGKILDVLAKHRFERQSVLVALGGGVIGDLTGFAAAIYQRGMPFVQIPTSLVAQVDSSVGGKTGVDHRLGKNLIGAFHQPRAVWIDPQLLRTLPKREWVAGLAEVIKYGIIADRAFFAYLERTMPALLRLEQKVVMQVVKRSCEIKAQVVAEDERESDRRRILNYGHTIGHALEAMGGYRALVHGEAVGIGLVLEAELARSQGYCDDKTVTRIRKVVLAAGLSDCATTRSAAKVWSAMQHDKKVSQGKVIGVWPEAIGRVRMAPLERQVFLDWFRASQGDSAGRRKQVSSRRMASQ
ncbi:MAG: 3-dehydroquinate synthase [Nitrospira sp.]|jgi:3-dehydroquinate synthase|nr:3-dehydroquinate synthase [Nitrospira sp.]